MTREPKPNHLRLVGDNELPKTLRGYAEVQSRLMVDSTLQTKLGQASLWLQTNGDIYGIRVFGSDEARLEHGGSFFIPVSYVGTRRLTHVDAQLADGTLYTVSPPRSPVAVFNISHNTSGDSEFMDTDIANCLQVGVRTEQAITLLDDDEYLDSLKGAWAYPKPVLAINNDRGTK